MAVFRFSHLDVVFTILSFFFLITDIVLDVLAALDFFWEEAYVRLGLLIFFLVGSSLLVQIYSWLWYGYEDFDRVTKVEKLPTKRGLKIMHFFQLGTYLRHLGVMEMTFSKYFCQTQTSGDVAVCLNHDLAMLRIVEAFSESLPQLVLMVTTNIQHGHLDPITVLKSVGSACAISITITMYHRSLRAFLPDRKKQTVFSTAVYFLWNLLLVASRVAALALFASEFPCFIFAHFVCNWIVLFLCAWRSETDFMDSVGGEWLFKGTVGLIWYFNWFNVAEGRTLYWTLMYHCYMFLDIVLLCGLWFWKMNPELPDFNCEHVVAFICIFSVYLIGLLIKIVYYKFFHPNVTKEEFKSAAEPESYAEVEAAEAIYSDEVDRPTLRSMAIQVEDRSMRVRTEEQKINKRMKKLAHNFYS